MIPFAGMSNHRSGNAIEREHFDGGVQLLALRQAGWHTVAQDEKTSVVYGMPRAAAQLDAAIEVLPLDGIAASVVRHAGKRNNT